MQALESVVAEVAPTNIPVLLTGESGTGKQSFANRLHFLSKQSDQQFLKVACSSVTSSTFQGMLGLSGGGKSGTVESETGTAFFDEVSELDPACQRSLLCSLPDGETPSNQPQLTARVISATSRNLEEEVRAGRFRSELYYRINGVTLRLPPLRERREDIPLLAEWFLTKHSGQLGRPRPVLSQQTVELFLTHSWPGNIRELENVVKKIVAIGDERVAVDKWEVVPSQERVPVPSGLDCSLKAAARAAAREAERELILRALTRTHWNRKRAAQELQISYKSLLYKLKQIAADNLGTI